MMVMYYIVTIALKRKLKLKLKLKTMMGQMQKKIIHEKPGSLRFIWWVSGGEGKQMCCDVH